MTCRFTVDPATGILLRTEAVVGARTVFRHVVTELGPEEPAQPVPIDSTER
ncbi:hypothetical protein ACIG5E_18405 [Kitasatospora sp. NPDC053057]|uniref:hypothetical protein n=1 Tax=Kitasatospora sp. NPDC053057 TaxID=3364062 RepID=UPI0037CA840E